jgi:hypothetical protein
MRVRFQISDLRRNQDLQAVLPQLKLACVPARSVAAATFALITRTARACASYPSCTAVYPRDSRSRRVLYR